MIARIFWRIIIGLSLLVLSLKPVKLSFFNSGIRWAYIILFSFLFAYFITPFCRAIARHFKILDNPDWRKVHEVSTPLLGGIGIYSAFILALSLNNIFLPGMDFLMFGATLILLMGLWDDIRPIKAGIKFIFQIIIALIVIIGGNIQLTFFYHLSWAPLVNIPLTVIWITGITNAMNFFDGMDGLAASMSVITATFLGIIAFNTDQPALGWFSVALIGSCLGFLPHNFRFGKSARIFLGDAGSTFLGFTLAGLAVLGNWSNTSRFVSLSAPILIFSVFIFDMIYITLSRIKNRQARNPLEILISPNRDHLHHRLLFMGFIRKEIVFIISVLSACLGVSALIIMNQRLTEALLGLFQAVLVLGLIATLMRKGRERIPKSGDRRVFKRRRSDRESNT